MQLKVGGKFHLRLNIGERPIAYKYREGKMKRTLERELTVCEIVVKETFKLIVVLVSSALLSGCILANHGPTSVFECWIRVLGM